MAWCWKSNKSLSKPMMHHFSGANMRCKGWLTCKTWGPFNLEGPNVLIINPYYAEFIFNLRSIKMYLNSLPYLNTKSVQAVEIFACGNQGLEYSSFNTVKVKSHLVRTVETFASTFMRNHHHDWGTGFHGNHSWWEHSFMGITPHAG